MRNLKRALSLALASVMLLGMMVVGASAASYTDVDDKDNVEAIEVLNAVNVMIGRQGNFEPDEAVNRHEMAVIMAKLVLGVETADNYVGSHPFTDVVPWADKYVAACYENGLVAGTSATTYGGGNPLTAVQAAAMMLRALGYEDLSKGADDWRAPVTAAANRIRLFDGVASNPSEKLDRNQVAQLALNTLKSPVVDTKQGLNITGSNGDYTFTINGDREYTARSSSKAFAKAIDATEAKGTSASSIGGCTIELGEQLYNGDLKLYNDRTDIFGRPARRWEYKGEEIGTYAKTELLRAEYTAEVTGRELYDLLGSSTVSDFDVNVTIDGIDASSANASAAQVFNKTAINRNNKSGVGGTGNGVLTQVYVDPNKGDKGTVDISIINTYLACATKDYDAKKETLDLDVYGLDKKAKGELVKSITTGSDVENLKVSSEDFAVEDVKEKDAFLVTVADGGIQTMQAVEPMSAVEITSFQARDLAKAGSGNLTTGGKKYNYSSAAEYDHTVLSTYTDGSTVNLKETTYDVYLDNYDNVIGVKEVSKPTNYVFITGVNAGENNLANVTLEANAIFLDGSMKKIEIDRKNSTTTNAATNFYGALSGNKEDNAVFNKWCTYSVSSSGIYTLRLVPVNGGLGTTAGQSHDTNRAANVNNKNLSVNTVGDNNSSAKAYGNNKSVYLAASVENISVSNGQTANIIDGVDSVTTGIDNVDVKPLNGAAADPNGVAASVASRRSHGIYTVYDKNGWIIAMVVIGDDAGKNSQLVYVHNASVAQEYYMGSDGYKWERTVIVDGVEKTLTEVNDTRMSMLQNMDQNKWYRIRTNSKDEVTSVVGYSSAAPATGVLDNDRDFPMWTLTPTSAPIAYNWSYRGANTPNGVTLVQSQRCPGVNTVLYHEAFDNSTMKVSGQTLYVTTGTDSGVRFAEDVKVVLDQMNDNKRTTEYYNGESGLKNAIRDLHPKTVDANGKPTAYDYEISAVIEGPYATSIVIRDNKADGNSGGALTPGGVAGAKAAITGADSNTALKIGYFGVAAPTTVADLTAIVNDWAVNTAGYARIGDPVATATGFKWDCYNSLGVVAKTVTLDALTDIVEGVRVRYTNETGTITGNGYEILSGTNAIDGSHDGAAWNVKDTSTPADSKADVVWIKNYKGTTTAEGRYIAVKTAGANTWTWSDAPSAAGAAPAADTEAGVVSINGHDYDVFLSTYTLKYRINNGAWKYTANANLIDSNNNEYTTTTFEAAYPGEVFGTIAKGAAESTVTYAALGNKAIIDGDTYTTGFVAIPKDAADGSSDAVTVKVNNAAVTASQGTNWVVPINTNVEIHIAYRDAAKTFRATGATTADITTVASTGGDGTIKTGTASVTFSALKSITLAALAKVDTNNTGTLADVTLEWQVNGQTVAAGTSVTVGNSDVVVAKVKFGRAGTTFDGTDTKSIAVAAGGGDLGTVTSPDLLAADGSLTSPTLTVTRTGAFTNETITLNIPVNTATASLTVTVTNSKT